ncbi:transporter substrate-binding domain-containing protein [Pelomonas sp. SE-A7]|uniref:substrate-binding periplasmic protein n=1 Tax=Pelomonas sp. SE-A7 TaxID=3054953 RepID=UPI00259D0567|nr:transporter substrate-binding domain-containing protein [Pelomonas sp. SE-A7]MDM4765029.1 transporter substrate-binding domain-containing protein [Pelomonas sp. SE-A7]
MSWPDAGLGEDSMRIHQILLVIALAAGLAPGCAAQGQPACNKVVVTADPEFPPYAWYDGEALRGASVDVVLSVLQAIKLPYELRYVGPFVRVLQTARFGEVDIITELKRNAEREQFLVYAETPIFTNPTSVFVRVGQELRFTKREDLRGLRGGATHGTRFGDGLDEFIEQNLNVEIGPGIKENFLKLDAGRIDYFISPHYPALSHLISSGNEAKYKALKPFAAEALNYVGWSRRSACLHRLAEFDAMLKRHLAGLNSLRLVDEKYEDWRRNPVMKR